ncbi:PAS domain-containing protein [Bdellovibrio sp. NC01]|uniref:PAS domain-containing protein n=1 Tax=Bdellovibrio sp. NC01 TaxID=2220073 RepID=UPI001158A855|nr:PAS domain-containing protein [Bdellovibrio sp. NC01]QDK38237.1 hypothetical protein DOE51_11925 [Bdellovibrio sp. NC01]
MSQKALLTFLEQRQLSVDPVALRLLKDQQLIRLWNSEGDLIYYNENMKKMTSYSPLDLCLYNIKSLYHFENDGLEVFKALAARALLGKDLAKERSYFVRESMGEQLRAKTLVDLAVPIFHQDQISGILIAGQSEIVKKAA